MLIETNARAQVLEKRITKPFNISVASALHMDVCINHSKILDDPRRMTALDQLHRRTAAKAKQTL